VAAQAESTAPPNALQGFSQNRSEPVKIDAASLEVRDKSKVATFSGNVHLVQGDTTMRCKVLVVFYDQEPGAAGPTVASASASTSPAAAPGNGQIRRMEAKGGVVVVQKDQTATGDSAIYDMKSNTVTLKAPPGGTVSVTQGPNVMRGDSLVVDLTTNVSHFEGRVQALVVPNSTKTDNKTDNKTTPDPKTATEKTATDSKTAPKDASKQQRSPQGLY
jgi:lipopolysaccharide export system protein LptA